eukprot:34141-Heterocapsa_arctica.AAC.1
MAPRSGKLDRLPVWDFPYVGGKRRAYRHANKALYDPPLPGFSGFLDFWISGFLAFWISGFL